MTCNKDANEELKQLMDAINAAWFEQQYDQFVRLFHQDIVFNSPDFSRQIKGREACVQSYRDFMRMATIRFFQGTKSADRSVRNDRSGKSTFRNALPN